MLIHLQGRLSLQQGAAKMLVLHCSVCAVMLSLRDALETPHCHIGPSRLHCVVSSVLLVKCQYPMPF